MILEEMECTLNGLPNCVIDTTGDYGLAFSCSDAMISTKSSLNYEYMTTGKPMLIFDEKPEDESAEQAFIDLRCNYYATPPDNMQFDAFIEMVLKEEDPLKQRREQTIHTAFTNMNGTAGEKAYRELLSEILI